MRADKSPAGRRAEVLTRLGSSAVEQPPCKRQVGGSNPFPGSVKRNGKGELLFRCAHFSTLRPFGPPLVSTAPQASPSAPCQHARFGFAFAGSSVRKARFVAPARQTRPGESRAEEKAESEARLEAGPKRADKRGPARARRVLTSGSRRLERAESLRSRRAASAASGSASRSVENSVAFATISGRFGARAPGRARGCARAAKGSRL